MLSVLKDEEGDYELNGGYSDQYKKVIWFGRVKVTKNYVGYHLIAVYAFPQLKKELSEALQQRMHGKSCFNFTELNDSIVSELSTLTARSVDAFRKAGWLEPQPA